MQRSIAYHLHRDLAAHQPREEQVAASAELLVLQVKVMHLREERFSLFIEGVDEWSSRHEDLGPLEIAGNDCRVRRAASAVLQVPDEGIRCCGLVQKHGWY